MRDNNLHRDQSGLVSIMVTIIMMLVISLIVLGFGQVTRRNQREALDRQLSTQAYYAAETGVNDVVNAIKTNTLDYNQDYTTDCNNFAAANPTVNPILSTVNGATAVSYSCVLVNPTPTSLVQANLQQNQNAIWPLIDSKSKPIQTVTFSWTVPAKQTAVTGCGAVPLSNFIVSTPTSCNLATLRVDLVNATSSSLNAAALISSQQTLYLQPSTTGSNSTPSIASFSSSTNDATVAQCVPNTASLSCSVTVNISSGASSSYYMRISTLYQDAGTVSVTGKDALGSVTFKNAQVMVDVTGKAQDVLRRLQVRIPLNTTTTTLPTNALQTTGNICKHFLTAPALVTAPTTCQ